MTTFGLRYVGPMHVGHFLKTETPLDEVWAQVSRFGIPEIAKFAAENWTPKIEKPWEEWGDYAIARIRQSVEFRRSLQSGSILTQPLPLYYSFLNLVRALIAFNSQEKSTRHGLIFQGSSDLMSASAKICKGTFGDYSKVISSSANIGDTISLRECFSCMPELMAEYVELNGFSTANLRSAHIGVDARHSGDLSLTFKVGPSSEEFERHWKSWFPNLADEFDLKEANCLALKRPIENPTLSSMARFAWAKVLPSVTVTEEAEGYAIMQIEGKPSFEREIYYYIAAFILGSAVRYEPEQLLHIANSDSLYGWAIKRFIARAERLFPNFVLNRFYDGPIFMHN